MAAALLGGCATSSVVLLQGEGGRPAGKVVVLDPKTGEDLRVVETAGTTVVVAGSRSRVRSINSVSAEAKYGDLLGNLPAPPKRFVLYYPEGSSELSSESLVVRDALLAEVKERGMGVDVQIEGHTDRVGDADDNIRLSRERARATLAMLVPLGLKDNVTRVVGRGEGAPVEGHHTADGVPDAKNRRVEVVVR